jgi:hypothetical protein|tara:strand:- start:693 stop:866 length:174 start_codon:yes stop_codon:yes gene_type:complete
MAPSGSGIVVAHPKLIVVLLDIIISHPTRSPDIHYGSGKIFKKLAEHPINRTGFSIN